MRNASWAALLALVVGLAAGVWLAEHAGSRSLWRRATAQSATVSTAPPTGQSSPAHLTPEEQRNILVYETANRSVVNIDTSTIIEVDSFWRMQRQAEGSGSGVVLDQQGHIITNFHVVDGAQKIEVTLASGADSFPARLVGGDKEHDIAILKIDAPADVLVPIPLGSSSNLRVGQRVFALGNPFGWDGTMTTGIISSLNRNLPSRIPGRDMQALIQTDAAMNPGNSGGPLLNSDAQMIGMCVAIASTTGQNSGVGFAIPIDRIRAVLPDLIEHGHIVRADIGISEVMETDSGLLVGRMNPEGPAAKAGLRGFRVVVRRRQQGPFVSTQPVIDRSQADHVVAVDGEPVRTGVRFRDIIWEHRPGDTIVLAVVRDGRRMDIPVTLAGD